LSEAQDASRKWLKVAHILRPRGNKGEVVAELFTDYPARLADQKQIYLSKTAGEASAMALENFWIDRNHPGMGVFHFAGCSTISDAEKFRGYDVLLPFEERVVLPAGQYFVSDLIGCTVIDSAGSNTVLASPACAMEEAPRVVGTVTDVFFPGERVTGTPLLQVETANGELLLPLAEDICTRINVAARRIDVRLPEGLDELNATER
jgi:16S rRNA processing protein RimM